MTREEARERIRQNKAAAEFYAGQSRITAEIENALKDSEAFDMAIEALLADTVSREVYDKRTQADEEIIDSYRQEFQKALSANRPKGEWIKKQVFNPELDKYVTLIECSVCGYEPYFGGSESKFNYCANCGARMEANE